MTANTVGLAPGAAGTTPTAAPEPALAFRGVTIAYGRVPVLTGVDGTVAPGHGLAQKRDHLRAQFLISLGF